VGAHERWLTPAAHAFLDNGGDPESITRDQMIPINQPCPSKREPRPAKRLEASICEACRIGNRIRQEHVMSLGSIPVTMTEVDRFWFWHRIDERAQRGSNRIDWSAILIQVEARIPRVDAERQTSIELNHLKERKQAAQNFFASTSNLVKLGIAPGGLLKRIAEDIAQMDGRIAELSDEADSAARGVLNRNS
jgi:hypothetical protein